jgi:hypothetical protein
MLATQQPQRAMAWLVSIERDLARHPRQRRAERLTKERLRSRDTAVSAKQEVDRLAMLVNRAIQVVPLRFDLEVRFINPPRRTDCLGESIPAFLKLRYIARYPSKDRTGPP